MKSELLIPSILMFVVLGVALFLVFGVSRWGKKKEGDATFEELRGFSPGDLDILKAQGLISEEETKRIQAIVAERTLEAMQRQQTPDEPAPDLNSLLSEAERVHRGGLKGAETIETEMKSDSEPVAEPPAEEGT